MRPKTKDAKRLNLYLDKTILPDLRRLADEEGVSQSKIIERFVRHGIANNFGGIRAKTMGQIIEHAEHLEQQYRAKCIHANSGIEFPSHLFIESGRIDSPSKVLWWSRHLASKPYIDPGLLKYFIGLALSLIGYMEHDGDFVPIPHSVNSTRNAHGPVQGIQNKRKVVQPIVKAVQPSHKAPQRKAP